MTQTPIILNVHFQAAPGHEEELGKQLLALVEPTRTEPGCLIYQLHFDPETPGKFMFYEKFISQDALDLHVSMPYLKNLQSYIETNKPIAAQTVTRWVEFA
jgi:quinol monooxygenase YgiN